MARIGAPGAGDGLDEWFRLSRRVDEAGIPRGLPELGDVPAAATGGVRLTLSRRRPKMRSGTGRLPGLQERPGVICPYCGEDNDRVIDSRASDGGIVVRRRRECHACGRRYTTYERVERTARLMVVKKDGSRDSFDTQKVLSGIQAACGKRPIPEELKARIVQEIEEEAHRDFEREIPSSEIGRRVARRLREVDPIAYMRYASEHYAFRTLEDFAQELSDLRARPADLPNQRDLFE